MEKQRKKFYITTPIYYVNDKPSVGHAYTTIISDILARWHRLKDEDVFFLTGLDENSQKTVQASIKLGFNDVKKFADYMATQWIEVWKKLNISNNDFIRTTEERHEKLVKDFIERVNKKKDIYKGKYSGLYCEGCEAFVNEDDLINGLCPYHQKAPKQIEEENYFFKLSKYQDKILKYIETKKDFIQPESRKNEILNFVKNGLKDISVSRQSMLWGIPFPNDEKHKVYVWFDALTNYLHPKEFWPANIHIIGKDIIKFHCIIWPAMLMSAEYKLPKKVFAHGFFTVNGQKMSKSLGNVIDPLYLVDKYGLDALRYYYAREIPFGHDGDFSENSLKTRLNNELANELGNLVSRILTLIEKNLNSEVKKTKIDKKLFADLNVKQIDKFMENLEIHNAIARIFGFIQDCNKYINDKKPWEIKDKEKLNEILYNLADALRIVTILLSSFLPSTSEKINKQLGISSGSLFDCTPGLLGNVKVKKEEILFKKIEGEAKEEIPQEFFRNTRCYVSPEVSRLGIKVRFAELIGLNIKKKHMGLEKLKDDIEKKAKLDENVIEGYEKVYKNLGLENIKCSVYNLIDLVKRGGKLPTINTLVDSYNLISLKYSLVVGAHDREKIKGSLGFKILNGTEYYIPLSKKEREQINAGEFGVIDEEKVLCRLDIKQGEQTKVTEDTKNIILYVEGNENASDELLDMAIKEMCDLILKFCGGNYRLI